MAKKRRQLVGRERERETVTTKNEKHSEIVNKQKSSGTVKRHNIYKATCYLKAKKQTNKKGERTIGGCAK